MLLMFMGLAGAAQAGGDYGLAPGDLVRVTVYDHPDLLTETRVNENGGVLFPLIGGVPVAGLSASDAAKRIAAILREGGFVRNPQVNLVVLEFKGQEISVLGRVHRPGRYPLQKASRLTDVLALAGGVTPDGADVLVLTSTGAAGVTRREIDMVALLRDGAHDLNVAIAKDDVLYVPREPRFYIHGEVQRPGAYRLERNMTVVQALSVGGGVTLRGTQRGLRILRRDDDGALRESEARLADALRPDDVIFVRESLF